MRKLTCASCNAEFPMAQMYGYGGLNYCGPCADKMVQTAGSTENFVQLIDPTICAKCSTDWGNNELPRVSGQIPICPPCREKVYNFEFPGWLKFGLAFCLILLVGALAHGAKYFKLGRSLYRGEHLLEQKQLDAAIENLAPVAAAAPGCEKCVLLASKAYLMNGQPDKAWAVAKTFHDGKFEDSADVAEVRNLFGKFERSAQLLEDAGKLYEQHKEQEALKLVNEAASAYPEWEAPKESASAIRVGIAFDQQDYDGFLSLAENYQKGHPKNMGAVAQLASALACKYAVTGELAYMDASRSRLAEAQELAQTDEDRKYFDEYSARIEHRLNTRKIISKEEYDRQFRNGKGGQQ